MKVAVIMGSESDKPVMDDAVKFLSGFDIAVDVMVASAHRNPEKVKDFATSADQHYDIIIAGAGKAAHLPGVIASMTVLPVIGVPIKTSDLGGLDSLYSIVQMPAGVPVATVAINGAKNAGILAAQILGLKYPEIKKKLIQFKEDMKTA